MNEIISFISQVGFPIVVSFYLLNRIEAKLDIMIQSIQSLSHDHGG
ncbi:MAG: YvrJ family protein [Bacillus sp. (in: firmicutes)]